MTLSTRLTIAMVALVLATAAAVGLVAVRGSGVAAGIVCVLVAVAVLISRRLTRPLAQVTSDVVALAKDAPIAHTSAGDDVGVLARAVECIATDVQMKDAALAQYAERERLYAA